MASVPESPGTGEEHSLHQSVSRATRKRLYCQATKIWDFLVIAAKHSLAWSTRRSCSGSLTKRIISSSVPNLGSFIDPQVDTRSRTWGELVQKGTVLGPEKSRPWTGTGAMSKPWGSMLSYSKK